jgi:hypothetical protein
MNKIVKIALGATIMLSLGSTVASADAAKGQKLYIKKLKKSCGFSGAVFAAKHTQDEWTKIEKDGKMVDEIKSICPNVKEKSLKSKYIEDYYDFARDFASDSGNVPSC